MRSTPLSNRLPTGIGKERVQLSASIDRFYAARCRTSLALLKPLPQTFHVHQGFATLVTTVARSQSFHSVQNEAAQCWPVQS